MPVFSYRAVNLNGEVYSGQTEKSSRALAEESLRESGLRIIELKKTGLFKRSIAGFEFFKPTLKPDEASLFLSQSAFMLGAGLDMVHMLRLVRNQSPNKRLQKVLAETEEGVVKGQSFSGELKKHRIIPEIISGAAEAGERSGRLPEIFAKLSGLYETEAKIADEIKKAMIYPVIVCAAILTVIIISVIFVLPGYARIFYYAGGELPVPTRLLLNAGEFIRVYYLRLFYFLCCLAVASAFFLNGKAGRYFRGLCLLRAPVVSKIYLKMVNMRFAYILGVLTGSGVDMPSSVRLIKRTVGNAVLEPVMERLLNGIVHGASLSSAMDGVGYFDPTMTGMIKIGEETGRLPETIQKCSDFLQYELNRMAGNLSKLIEPLITVVLGLILAFVMLAVMLPSFTLTNLL